MQKPIQALRGTLAIALVAALLSAFTGAFATPASAQEGPDLLPDHMAVQGVICEDSNLAGTFAYLLDVTYIQGAPENCRVAAPGEHTFAVLNVADPNIAYDVVDSGADGYAYLDVPVETEFFLLEAGDSETTGGSWSFFVSAGEETPLGMTVIEYVPQEGVEPSPSGEPTPENDLNITGWICEDTDLAGTYEYLLDVTFSAGFPDDCRVAGEGEHTYFVVDAATEEDIAVVSTDANGVAAVAEMPTDALFWLIEENDFETLGSEDIYLPGDDSISSLNVTVIEYISSDEPEPELAPGTVVLDTMACTFDGPVVEIVVLGPAEAAVDNAGNWDEDFCYEVEGAYLIYPFSDFDAEPILVEDFEGGPLVFDLPSTTAADGDSYYAPHTIIELVSGEESAAEFLVQEEAYTSINVTYFAQDEEPAPTEEPSAEPTERPAVPTAAPSATAEPTAAPSDASGGEVTELPSTGAGTTSSDAGLTNSLIALATVAGLAAVGFGLRKRIA